MEISGHTKLACLLGDPVEHSISPAMHNTAFAHQGIDCTYLAFQVGQDQLEQVVTSLRQMQVVGFNLTMPNKNKIVQLVDVCSPAVEIGQSANTVVNENGVLKAYTTDGIGFMDACKEVGFPVIGHKMTLLGAGGAARSILIQAALDGATAISVFSRRGKSWEQVESVIEKLRQTTKCQIDHYDYEDPEILRREIEQSQLLVNGTSVGMAPDEDQSVITDPTMLRKDLCVYDVIYNPAQTKLLSMAKAAGCRTCNGLSMLLYQGAAAFELWTGQKMPVDLVRKKCFASKEKVFLIGFMGAGKSTVAAQLSVQLSCPQIEMDQVIEEQEQQKIPDIFEQKGEGYFRDLETALLEQLESSQQVVVSCGGGAVLRPENVASMKKQGKVVLLTATPETVLARVKGDTQRPNLKGRMNVEAIAQLMEVRRQAYETAADLIISTDDKTAKDIAAEIVEKMC